nr:reverse transcriptase domain-containing protein [Tanacetum cinerariifolium]
MNFMVVRSRSPYNGIIGRSGLKAIQAIPSTIHGMLKFPVKGGIITIRNTILIPNECALVTTSSVTHEEKKTHPTNFTVAVHPDFPDQEVVIGGSLSDKGRTELCFVLKKNLDIFAWQPSDMTGVSRSVAEHRLNIQEGYTPVRQKKRGQAPERAKDCYPLLEIDWKVESLCGYPFKCFLDAYKGYHQIQLAKADEEKTAFHTGQEVYCYTKMPFSLKNVGATYQRLMDKAFESQMGRNIEVYVDDLVVKSRTEAEMVKDIEETLRTLRKINMKLNPKKCSFGLAEGVFLGYVITPEGIKPCPDKTAVVLQLPSLQTVKEVQSLNGKLASLNRKISAYVSNLKKCIKKSDFSWTAKAEQAFQQLKQHLSELPLLVAPNPQEELIMYLSPTHRAASAVLMTERGTTQMLIYFISRALQGPELNHSPMEKLVLSLVFAAKRLCRYFQAHPITVITDQPIKQVMTRPDVARRLQKWSIMLGEHNIAYRPRTSVKGQILADFLTEMPDGVTRAYPAEVAQEEPWTLFTDGSSCVDGSGAGLILTNPEGVNVDSKLVANQVLGMYVAKENNVIKYLEIVKGLTSGFTTFSINQVPRSKNKQAGALSKIASTSFAYLSKQVLVEVLKNKSIREKEVAAVIEEDGLTWMTQIVDYLKDGVLLGDNNEAKKLRLKARQYELKEGVLYRPTLGLRHGPDSYGRQQWGIFRNGRKPDGAIPHGAVVIQRMQALSGMIRRKASVGGFLSPPSNPRAQLWTGGGNYQAGTIGIHSNDREGVPMAKAGRLCILKKEMAPLLQVVTSYSSPELMELTALRRGATGKMSRMAVSMGITGLSMNLLQMHEQDEIHKDKNEKSFAILEVQRVHNHFVTDRRRGPMSEVEQLRFRWSRLGPRMSPLSSLGVVTDARLSQDTLPGSSLLIGLVILIIECSARQFQRTGKVSGSTIGKRVTEASSIHIDFGFSAPYFDLPFLRYGIPNKSLTPRIQWDFIPGESYTLPPLIKTIECFFGVLVSTRGRTPCFWDIDLKLEYGPCALFLLYHDESIDLMSVLLFTFVLPPD